MSSDVVKSCGLPGAFWTPAIAAECGRAALSGRRLSQHVSEVRERGRLAPGPSSRHQRLGRRRSIRLLRKKALAKRAAETTKHAANPATERLTIKAHRPTTSGATGMRPKIANRSKRFGRRRVRGWLTPTVSSLSRLGSSCRRCQVAVEEIRPLRGGVTRPSTKGKVCSDGTAEESLYSSAAYRRGRSSLRGAG